MEVGESRTRLHWLLRTLNAAAPLIERVAPALCKLTPERIVASARRRTGLHDLGDQRCFTPLRTLCESYQAEADLTLLGRLIAQRMLVHLVVNRQLIHAAVRATPDVQLPEITRPLFVVGLPRTGTTLMYNLLARDPGGRPLMCWESMHPVADPHASTAPPDPRIARTVRTVRMMNWAIPQLRSSHDFNATGPEECLGLLLNTFYAPFFRGRIERYREWLAEVPHSEALAVYAEYRRQLQLLQGNELPHHWLLKCPCHLIGMSALLETFPDATVVWMHRDPAQAIPSLCSQTAMFDGLMYERVDREQIGQRTLGIIDQMLEGGLRAVDSPQQGRLIHIQYADLVEHPIDTVAQIYDRIGTEPPAGMQQGMHEHLTATPRHKHGPHRYAAEDFGLTEAGIHARYGDYLGRFIDSSPP